MKAYKSEESEEEVTVMVDGGSASKEGTQQVGAALGVKAPKRSEFREGKTVFRTNQESTWWCVPRPRLGRVEMAVAFPSVPATPGTPFAQTIFCRAVP